MFIPSNRLLPSGRSVIATIWLALIITMLPYVLRAQPQCELSTINGEPIIIEDFDTISLRFTVDGAIDSLIGQDFQGICAVRLRFRHGNLSDLNITLTSPDGNDIILVGPALGDQTTPQQFAISHDVIFRPRPNVVTPHPDLQTNDNRWNSSNINWGSLSFYDGSYYPFSGDLLDSFDGDNVNGIWEITIIDPFLNDEGVFEGVEIEFCEDDGLACNACEAVAGTFVTPIAYLCQGDDFSDLTTVYDSSATDPVLYTEDFFIYDNSDNLVLADADPDWGSLDSGTYTVHAFNILTDQYAAAASGLQGLIRGELLDSVAALGGVLCMDMSDPLVLRVNVPDSTFTSELLCFGDTTFFHGQAITTTGRYTMPDGTCDMIDVLDVRASQLQVFFDRDTVLTDCSTGTIEYGPLVTGATGPISYEWSVRGSAVVVGNDSSFVFSSTEDYQLSVTDGVCSEVLFISSELRGQGFSVSIDARPQVINCVQDSVDLVQISNFSTDSVIWYRDGVEFARNVTLVTVRDEANYEVTVYGDGGCEVRDNVNIIRDTKTPEAVITAPEITCTETVSMASFVSQDDIEVAIWMQDGDTISTGSQVFLSEGGDYDLLLIGTNQCRSTESFTVTANDDILEIQDVQTGEVVLTCDNRSFTVSPQRADDEIVDEYWIFGADDTVRGGIDIVVSMAGRYRYQVLTSNDCISEVRFDALVDTLVPRYTLIPDSITCERQEARLLLSGLLPPSTIVTFSGDDILSTTDSSATVNAPGDVLIEVLDPSNGCSATEVYEVVVDESIPDISIPGDTTLTCNDPEATLMASFISGIPERFYWIMPQGDTTFIQSLVVSDTGRYVFEAIGRNGCDTQASVFVDSNIDVPDLDIDNQITISCEEPSLRFDLTAQPEISAAQWILEGDTTSGLIYNAITTTATSVEVNVLGINGCPVGQVIDILYDTIEPSFNLQAGTLTCDVLEVDVSTDVALNNHLFTWAGPNISNESGPSITVSEPGAYALNVVDTTNGCSRLGVPINVDTNYVLPIYTTLTPDTITCDLTSINLSVDTDVRNEVVWSTSDGLQSTGRTIISGATGLQLFTITGSNGCSMDDSVEVFTNLSEPTVNVQNEYVISCNEPEHLVQPEILDPFRLVLWRFKNGLRTTTNTETIRDDNLESLVVTGDNGCETIIPFDISFSDDQPDAEINTSDTLVCSGQSIDVSTSPVVSDNHRIFWYRDNVLITEGQTDISTSVSGDFRLQVIDTTSGCYSEDTVSIIVSDEPLNGFDIDIMDETCVGAGDGFIHVRDVLGGVGQVELLLEGSPISFAPVALDIPDTYMIEAIDELGCMQDTFVTIVGGGMINVDIGPDQDIERGEKATVISTITGDEADTTIWWSSSLGVTGSNQDTLCYFPLVDDTIVVQVQSITGCIDMDTMLISVFVDISKIAIYVPNIMAIGSQAGNDRLVLDLSPDIVEVSNFAIYDRWGQQVMYEDRLIGGETASWDGTFNGAFVTSGVYVYSYDMLTIYDDIRRRRRGDITVIR